MSNQKAITAIPTAAGLHVITDDQQSGENSQLLDQFLERYVYIELGDMIYDMTRSPRERLSTLKEFQHKTSGMKLTKRIQTGEETQRQKKIPLHVAWLEHPERKTALKTVWIPGEGRLVYEDEQGTQTTECRLNTFSTPVFNPVITLDNIQIFVDHMNYLFPHKKERDWFIQWMAFNVKHPEKRCKVTPLHVSELHGTGRGWLVELMGRLLGEWNVTKAKMKDLVKGDFQNYFNGSLLCAIEEVQERNKKFSVASEIRADLTEDRLLLNYKYGRMETGRVFANFFFQSNHSDAMYLPKHDRRINVFTGPDTLKDMDYYQRLYNWLYEGNGVEQLHSHLTKMDLTEFNFMRSMDTHGRQRMLDNNQSETESLFWDLMENPRYVAMTFKQIVRAMKSLGEGCLYDVRIDESQLTKLLQSHTKGQCKRMKVWGKAVRPWPMITSRVLTTSEVRIAVEQCGEV